MKTALLALAGSAVFLSGCAGPGPAVSKETTGNLEVHVSAPPGLEARAARLFVDGHFVGNVSERWPVLHLKRGRRSIKVELPGAVPYEQTLTILGDPNHQVLNVLLEKL